MKSAAMIAVLALALAAPVSAADSESSLKSFLQTDLSPRGDRDLTTRYLHAFVDLDGDGTPEAIVYISGRMWCGSGGCRMLILRQEGSSFKVVTHTTVTRTPIRVLETTSHGWHNLSVWVAGGGIQPHEVELRFDGKAYPTNPSVPPARPLDPASKGKVVIDGREQGPLLYP